MKTCDAWLNGKCVGKVQIQNEGACAVIRCDLPDGWIYRAVLFSNGIEIGRFGVLLPENGVFSATSLLTEESLCDGALHCEILKNRPGEITTDGTWLTWDQCALWDPSVFALEQTVLKLVKKKKGVQYRVYNQKKYLLFPVNFTEEDPLVSVFCVGKMIELQKKQFLCVNIAADGEIVPG